MVPDSKDKQIINILEQELANLSDPRSPVILAYLYGSRSRGRYTILSDVGIALVTEEALPPLARLDLELDLEVKLAAAGIEGADVRLINQAPVAVKGRVVTEGKLIYCRDDQKRIEFETMTRSQYLDLQPFLKKQWKTYCRAAKADLEARGFYDS
jgi:hypothetical protein